MIADQRAVQQSLPSSTLADILERVLDKGVVIAGDIKIKLCDVELLTIQIRLLICSVDKAKEMGIDWWTRNPAFCSQAGTGSEGEELAGLRSRVEGLEAKSAAARAPAGIP
jgi:hypothetical protein